MGGERETRLQQRHAIVHSAFVDPPLEGPGKRPGDRLGNKQPIIASPYTPLRCLQTSAPGADWLLPRNFRRRTSGSAIRWDGGIVRAGYAQSPRFLSLRTVMAHLQK